MRTVALNNHLRNADLLREEFYIFNCLYNVVVAVDAKGRVIIFNPASERVFNYPASKALGRPIKEVIPYTGLLKVLQTGKPHIGRKFVVGNTLFIVNRTPIVHQDKVVGAIGVAQEITELHQLGQELREAREMNNFLQSIVQSTQEGYLAVNNEGRIIMVNRPMAELLEIPLESASGRHITEVIPDKRLQLLLWKGKLEYGEMVHIRGQDVVVIRAPLYNQGKIAGAISKVIFQDVDQLLHPPEKLGHCQREGASLRVRSSTYPGARYTLEDLVGESHAMQQLKALLRRVAQGPSTVLIQGESGTGKELAAHALHNASPRCRGPFVRVNCAAVPENLLESELFGYQEGAFTGARRGGQVGKFEQAHGGTIFLDEIGDMPLAMQAKILRVLQEREVERLGDSRPRTVDVRVIAATNRNLEELVRQGQFREDLYYRLNVVTLQIPPLRERMEDLPCLVHHFLKKLNQRFGLAVRDLSREAWEVLASHDWPGNVRELENVLERAFNLVEGHIIEVSHLPPYLQKAGGRQKKKSSGPCHLTNLLQEVEKEALLEALAKAGGNKMKAARALGISRAWLYKKMKQYGIGE